ncbi:MAG: TraR/DksA family transcriptional regulator [bacterium]
MNDIKQLLLAQKEEILSELRDLRAEEIDVSRRDIGDDIDHSVESQEHEMRLLLQDRERLHLEEIEEALNRIGLGEYGYCEECGDEIPKKRLVVMPLARMCVACQQEQERSGSGSYSRDSLSGYSLRED